MVSDELDGRSVDERGTVRTRHERSFDRLRKSELFGTVLIGGQDRGEAIVEVHYAPAMADRP